ncbi:zinc metallopeptidase [Paenisporosarcina quisquiliarum]|uniref:Zinc metallopeptidase n=1 Tax=Paenisporosarcina quisquiliarum TaxID=365346 RepID=A0A9X3LGJ6_9BACL|nr:neutral zinc metallopeptidase [Paenisporosarcina quisquiliarum]MCZ8536989.1 zinc metallopeptidase [Paenisporosarcina quisquiliarum]
MKWRGRGQSANVEDRRGMGAGGIGIAGGGIGLVIVIIMTLLGGGGPGDILNSIQGTDTNQAGTYEETEQEKELADFVSVVLADTETVWSELFKEAGTEYQEPVMVLYNGQVQSACGAAGSSVGPFYCPGDYKLYIDLSFYEELNKKFQAPGDFAMAYVVAHEVGHHVQTLLGTNKEVMALRNKMSEEEFNQYLIRLELQADYYAGVFAHYAEGEGYLEVGDIEEAITAASAVGDDNIQKKTQGYVVPESFTHGTSEQRMRWFKKGYEAGTIEDGDTFKAKDL